MKDYQTTLSTFVAKTTTIIFNKTEMNDAEMTLDIPSEMEIVPPSDDASEISDLVADEKDEFYHKDDQPDEADINPVADEKDEIDNSADDQPDEADVNPVADEKDESDQNDDKQNDADSTPVADEKHEFDHNDYQHDELSLNPIEDDEILDKILDIQNRGCCDTAVENSIKKMQIPEEVIESILCKADKQLCTCEATAFVEKATGYNICVADGESIVIEDEEKSNLESVLVKNEIVADDDKTVASTDMETSTRTDGIAVGTVNTSSVVNDEKSSASSVEAPSEIPESAMEEEGEDDDDDDAGVGEDNDAGVDEDDHDGVECTLASNPWFQKKVKDDAIKFRPKKTSKWSRFISKISSKKAPSSKLSPHKVTQEEEDGVVEDAVLKLESPVVIEISV